jgi:pyruvate kinase
VFTENRQILTQLNLVWGVKGYFYDKLGSTDQTIVDCQNYLKDKGLVNPGDYVINVASVPIEEKGKSNMVKLSQI